MELRPEILLHPNIPKPLHGIAPRTILGKDWWDKHRQIAYAKNDYRCWACGVHKTDAKYHQWLEAHEFYEIDYAKGRVVFVELVALCHACHNFIHDGRMVHLVDEGKMDEKQYREILKHGNRILAKAGLVREDLGGPTAEWGKWRLVLEGKEYKGKWKSYEDWYQHYCGGKYG